VALGQCVQNEQAQGNESGRGGRGVVVYVTCKRKAMNRGEGGRGVVVYVTCKRKAMNLGEGGRGVVVYVTCKGKATHIERLMTISINYPVRAGPV
jgi:hypothetical protein